MADMPGKIIISHTLNCRLTTSKTDTIIGFRFSNLNFNTSRFFFCRNKELLKILNQFKSVFIYSSVHYKLESSVCRFFKEYFGILDNISVRNLHTTD